MPKISLDPYPKALYMHCVSNPGILFECVEFQGIIIFTFVLVYYSVTYILWSNYMVIIFEFSVTECTLT